MTLGFSDRIAHALAFAAKHGGPPPRRGDSSAWPVQPAGVAVILARYGAEEATIVAGILSSVVNDSSPARRHELAEKIAAKFGPRVHEILRQVVEPRYDARGKERGWEAWKLDFLAGLALADRSALEVAAANEIHVCGSLLTDVRRLGAEYLSSYAPGGTASVVGWFREMVDTLEQHPTGPRPGMLVELRSLSARLAAQVEGP
jgi:(p)ppGpp synthase/HD superfamily hydrolase